MSVHLILGGARSGKSAFAERTALAHSGPLYYVATGTPDDDEMAARIRHHRQRRDPRFTTLDSPLDLAATLARYPSPEATVVVDCLTLWVSNWLTGRDESGWAEQRQALLDRLTVPGGRILLVSNEVGLGIVPMGELSRRFVDETGRLHQDIAELAEQVTFMVAGLPQRIK